MSGLIPLSRWLASSPTFLFHVKALAKKFAGRFVHLLDRAVTRDDVRLPTDMQQSPSLYLTARDALRQKSWNVYAKPPFGGPEQVLRYLARYTHRVAVGNSRLVSLENDHVTFRYKSRSSEAGWKTKRLPAVEFLRRFTLHVLPPGFVRIRYFGFLAHRNRRKAVATCREQLGDQIVDEAIRKAEAELPTAGPRCPKCERATLVELRGLPREPPHSRGPPA